MEPTYFTNHFLIAMPTLDDPHFARSVTYICEHSANGAIGIIINHPLELSLSEVLKQMDITVEDPILGQVPILSGGPVHPERGFVLHPPSGPWRSSLEMNSEICVTTSRDILEAIANKQGPEKVAISLGYSSWTAGQLEEELLNNYWLTSPVNMEILFDMPFEKRWEASLHLLGINIHQLSNEAGHG